MSPGPSSAGAGGRRFRWLSVRTASILTTGVTIAELALAQELVAVGHLSCESQRVVGSAAAQREKLFCAFVSAAGGMPSNFLGEIEAIGSPIGVSARTRVVWQVLTVGGVTTRGLLTGSYSNAASSNQIEGTLLRGGPNGETYLRVVSVDGHAEPSFVTEVAGLSLRPAE
ncbi:MAG: DUF992 domain-containing protein [Microvirga sp.]